MLRGKDLFAVLWDGYFFPLFCLLSLSLSLSLTERRLGILIKLKYCLKGLFIKRPNNKFVKT